MPCRCSAGIHDTANRDRAPAYTSLYETGPSLVLLTGAVLALAAVAAYAQGYRFREGSLAARYAPPHMPDAGFVVCRLAYRSVRVEPMGIGWQTDYPFAEINLTTRLSELTKTRVSRSSEGQPNHFVVRLTDDALFNCPMTMASDVGSLGFGPGETDRLLLIC